MPSNQSIEREAIRNLQLGRAQNMSAISDIPGTIPFQDNACRGCGQPIGARARGATQCAACAGGAGLLYEAADNRATLALTIDRLGRELQQLKLALLTVFASPQRCPTCEQPFQAAELFAWTIAFPFSKGRATWRHNCAAAIIAQVNYLP